MKDLPPAILEGLIHNIRTPLNLILGYVHRLKQQVNCDEAEQIYKKMPHCYHKPFYYLNNIYPFPEVEFFFIQFFYSYHIKTLSQKMLLQQGLRQTVA